MRLIVQIISCFLQKIKYELPKFGGYFKGKDARYIVFGQNNHESDNTKEVVRVVKYDDDWNKLGQCSITSKMYMSLSQKVLCV